MNEESSKVYNNKLKLCALRRGYSKAQAWAKPVAYKVTMKRKHADKVAPNLLNQNFNPVGHDEVWAGDVTYLRTAEGWMYLAIVGLNRQVSALVSCSRVMA